MDYPSLFLESDSIQNVFSSKRKRGVGLPTQSEYKCKTCEYKTTKKELMRQHNVVKHSGHVNKCSDCDYAHYFPGKVRKHFNYVHLGIKRQNKTQGRLDCFKMDCKNTQREDCKEMGHNKVECKECDFYAFTARTINVHKRREHEGILFSCNQCDFKCAREDQLDIHKSSDHDGEVFSCNQCSRILNTKRALKMHILSCHGPKIYECDKCNYKCADGSTLKKHIKTSHERLNLKQKNKNHSGRTKEIVNCFDINCTKSSIENCIEMKHNKLSCSECEYFAYSKQPLARHKRRYHMGEAHLYRCAQCSFETLNKSHLERHISFKHEYYLTVSQMYRCPQCSYHTDRHKTLEKHISTLHESQILFCGQCDRRFKAKTVLDRHAQSAHNKICCMECNYFAYSDRAMQNHNRRIHKGVHYKHRCSQCSFDAREKYKLKKHVQDLHDGEHTFCVTCDKNFKSETSLSKHALFDHEETTDATQCEDKYMKKKDRETEEEYDKYDSYNEDEEVDKIATSGELMGGEDHNEKPQEMQQSEKTTFKEYDKYDSHNEDEEKGKFVTCGELINGEEEGEKSVPQVLQQQYETETQTSKSERITTLFKCDSCSFSTENQSISKLHHLSHKFPESQILETIPSSLKDLTFDSEEEFNQNIEMFLTSLSS